MAYSNLKHAVAGSVVDGKGTVNSGDIDISHDSVSVKIKLFIVQLSFFVGEEPKLSVFIFLVIISCRV